MTVVWFIVFALGVFMMVDGTVKLLALTKLKEANPCSQDY